MCNRINLKLNALALKKVDEQQIIIQSRYVYWLPHTKINVIGDQDTPIEQSLMELTLTKWSPQNIMNKTKIIQNF